MTKDINEIKKIMVPKVSKFIGCFNVCKKSKKTYVKREG